MIQSLSHFLCVRCYSASSREERRRPNANSRRARSEPERNATTVLTSAHNNKNKQARKKTFSILILSIAIRPLLLVINQSKSTANIYFALCFLYHILAFGNKLISNSSVCTQCSKLRDVVKMSREIVSSSTNRSQSISCLRHGVSFFLAFEISSRSIWLRNFSTGFFFFV